MTLPHAVRRKSVSEIASEWDALAAVRAEQLTSHLDPSYDAVLVPAVMRLLGPMHKGARLLDVGCGTGFLTAQLAPRVRRTVAVDPSISSVEHAARYAAECGLDGINWHATAIEDFQHLTTERFDYIVANMTLMDAPDLERAVSAISKLAADSSTFVWTVTHPWFWPRYWGYDDAPWFRYESELFIEAEFRISNASTGLTSTHVHRPLQQYIREMSRNGFVVHEIEEPTPPAAVMSRYPKPWIYPRFLAARCTYRARDAGQIDSPS